MKVTLEYFGPIGDRMSDSPDMVTLGEKPSTLAALINQLEDKLEGGEALRDPHLRIAINDQLCGKQDALALTDGDRIAFLSPFSGG